MAFAASAQAAPTNGSKALFFDNSVCTNLAPPNVTRRVDFVVQGNNGRDVAHTSAGGTFQVLALSVTVNGAPDTSFVKNNVGQAQWSCNGQTTVTEGGDMAVVAFTALGNFHP